MWCDVETCLINLYVFHLLHTSHMCIVLFVKMSMSGCRVNLHVIPQNTYLLIVVATFTHSTHVRNENVQIKK